jgi:hypothetical protein
MYYTNCHRTNHNAKTYRVKRKENLILVVFEVTIQHIKVERLVKYCCHICGYIGHKSTNCSMYNDMQNMFKNKGVKLTKKQVVVEPKVSNP